MSFKTYTQIHAGRTKDGDTIWHMGVEDGKQDGQYWTGLWNKRTPKELFEECKSTIIDLLINHPELTNS